MSTIRYEIKDEGRENFLKINPALSNTDTFYKIEAPSKAATPWHSFTATTDMKDAIGSVTRVYERDGMALCSVKSHFRGKQRELHNIKIIDSGITKRGDRVMITEHIRVNGKFEIVASKKKLLDPRFSGLTFINVGWKLGNDFHHIRVDPYTGEAIQLISRI